MPFTFHPLLFLSHTTLAFCRLTCPHEHLGWQLKDFADLLWLRGWLACLFRAPSLGRCPTVYSQICLCFTQNFFSNCTLFTSETKTWKLSWCVNGRADPTSFHTELILLLLHSSADLIHYVHQCPPPSYSLVLYIELSSGSWHFDMFLNYAFIFQPWLFLFDP